MGSRSRTPMGLRGLPLVGSEGLRPRKANVDNMRWKKIQFRGRKVVWKATYACPMAQKVGSGGLPALPSRFHRQCNAA